MPGVLENRLGGLCAIVLTMVPPVLADFRGQVEHTAGGEFCKRSNRGDTRKILVLLSVMCNGKRAWQEKNVRDIDAQMECLEDF